MLSGPKKIFPNPFWKAPLAPLQVGVGGKTYIRWVGRDARASIRCHQSTVSMFVLEVRHCWPFPAARGDFRWVNIPYPC